MKYLNDKNEWQYIQTMYDETYWRIIKRFAESAYLGDEEAIEHIQKVTEMHSQGMKSLDNLIRRTI